MSTKEILLITCDKCGARIDEDNPLLLTVGMLRYQLDLCDQHRRILEGRLAPWLAIASPPPLPPAPARSRRAPNRRRGELPAQAPRRPARPDGSSLAVAFAEAIKAA